MSVSVRAFNIDESDLWDDFCEEAIQATFLHTRRFLSYHDENFTDRSVVLYDDYKLVGLFPAAQCPKNDTYLISHPGATFGGMLHQGSLRGERMLQALREVCRYYREQGYVKLIYKVVPTFYHRVPANDDLYALFRLGAFRARCDLSSTIDLQHRLPLSERRRRSLNKAIKADIDIVEGKPFLAPLWAVLSENLARKHDAKPVHTLEQITMLSERFPNHIRCICARINQEIIAGIVLFLTATTHHAQYIASSERGNELSALDAVFDHAIRAAVKEQSRWFDFGISNENQGKVLNDGLYRFKSEFGGGGTVHEFYEIDLTIGDLNVLK